MAVTTTHPTYDHWRYRWESCRDIIEGRDAIMRRSLDLSGRTTRIAGSLFGPVITREDYLPRLSGQTDAEYRAYLGRAAFFGATGRTVDALVGMVMAKPPTINLPAPLDEYAEDITLSACPLREFVQQVLVEEISITRVGILVDYPQVDTSGLSRAAAEQLNIRPFLRHYTGETIINWRTTTVNGAQVLTLVVLSEVADLAGDDEFTVKQATRYRVLDLTEQGYRVRVMNDKGELLSEVFPRMNGAAMGFIPFAIVGGPDIRKPVLMDLVDTNIAHYRNSADLEHGLHFVGMPTPYVAGVSLQPGESLNIGGTSAWILPDPAANAGFLEFKGDGLQSIERAMMVKQQQMAVLGARMLTEEKRTAEAENTVSMRTAGERSILAATAGDVSDAIRQCLKWMAQWSGVNPEAVEFALNIDYGAQRMNAQMLTALVGAWQNGAIPMQVLFNNLQRGEIAPPDMEFEDFEGQLETAEPTIDTPTASAQPAGLMAGIRASLGL